MGAFKLEFVNMELKGCQNKDTVMMKLFSFIIPMLRFKNMFVKIESSAIFLFLKYIY